jgi:hypothetical protein
VKRYRYIGEKGERKKRRAPTEAFFFSLPFSRHTNLTPYFDLKQGQGVEIAL